MSKNRTYKVEQKKKEKNKIIKGGYLSSLAGVSQTDRAELFKEQRRGSGVFENKKRKSMLKPKHKKVNYQSDSYHSCAFNFGLDKKITIQKKTYLYIILDLSLFGIMY